MYNEKLINNPLQTKSDAQAALRELLRPLENHFETSKYGLKFDDGGAIYAEKTREIEALLRPLWGIIPCLAGGGDYAFLGQYIEKINQGVDPSSPSYWGEITSIDQKMVEMAVLATGLCLAKAQLWDVLTTCQQANLHNWLIKINDHDTPENNWRFFRILVNVGFKNCGAPYSEAAIERDLADINSYYLGNGWYADGKTDQIDYYVPFAIHFYSLIYVATVGDADPVYTPLFKERARLFAQDFQNFFDINGVAVPFGRSMIYRFAQAAFWATLALADVEALPWGEIKYLCLQNLRHWFKQNIFTKTGELNVGYYYRNLVMAEGYNAFGSPYWALKTFAFLAIPDKHPFWQAVATPPKPTKRQTIPQARTIICRNANNTQIQMFPVGQNCGFLPAHAQAKYEKFVYASAFGFSVPKGAIGLSQGAFDSTLAVSEGDQYYRMRYGVCAYALNDDYLVSVWQPWDDVTIKSYIIPLMPWHVRIHLVKTKRQLSLAEGGFCVDAEGDSKTITLDAGIAYQHQNGQLSGVVNLHSFADAKVIALEPNTSLYYARTMLPTLTATVAPGSYLFASAIVGALAVDGDVLQKLPSLTITDAVFKIQYGQTTIKITKDDDEVKTNANKFTMG